jgi:NADH-quinone oxidoreductase subunit N
VNPHVDFHALAPEIVLTVTIVAVLVADLFTEDGKLPAQIAAFGVLGSLVPVLTLAVAGGTRSLFGGAFVVDPFSLVLTGFFLVAGYVTLLVSFDYIGDGDYYQGEYYVLLLTSLLGMVVISSARDLVSIFVALETITIPTFILAGWRKHDTKSNEAGLKYFLIGVLSSAVMLYGMSLVFGLSKSTVLVDIHRYASGHTPGLFAVAVFLTLVGFAFKVSAVPFHFWAPDTYEGAPTPVTAFLSVASKAGGFVALLTIIRLGFFPSGDSWQPILWVLAAASMTLGNLAALRQTNIVRMLAYSSIAQGGFILVPLAVAGDIRGNAAWQAVVIYILIYGAMNLGAFACVIAATRRTRSGEISRLSGFGRTNPTISVMFSIFLLSLAGVPPLAGWFAKFVMFRAVFAADTTAAVVLGVIAAVNSVIAFFYYSGVVRRLWFDEPAEGVERETGRLPLGLTAAMGLMTAVILVVGVYPQFFARLGQIAFQRG